MGSITTLVSSEKGLEGEFLLTFMLTSIRFSSIGNGIRLIKREYGNVALGRRTQYKQPNMVKLKQKRRVLKLNDSQLKQATFLSHGR